MKGEDGVLLDRRQPVISRDPCVVFVDFAVPLFPVIEFPGLNADPGDDLFCGNRGAFLPVSDVVDDVIADIVGNPASI